MIRILISYILPILTLAGLGYLYFTIKNLLPSYFSEKGKNIATKEDVSDITELIETVKHSFTTETEKLKANLNLLTNIHFGLLSEERNAIVDMNEKYFKWLNILTDTSLNGVDEFSNEELNKYRKLLKDYYTEFVNSESKFGLFVDNEELLNLTDDLKLVTLEKLAYHPMKCSLLLIHNNTRWEVELENIALENKLEKQTEYLSTCKKIQEEFHQNMLNDYKIVSPKAKEFQNKCREYIYELVRGQEVAGNVQ